MDKQNEKVRKYICQRAELIGAIRLPNNTFKDNAGTVVTSDIIFLKKRDKITDIEDEWVHLDKNQDGIEMNSYFVKHPEMILGKMEMTSGRFGPESTCSPIYNETLETQLNDEIENIQIDERSDNEEISIPAIPEVRNFSYAIVDNKIYYRENSLMYLQDKPITALNRIKGMIEIRDCVRRIIDLQIDDSPDFEITAEQQKLNRLYDNFSKKYGLINSRGNEMAFSDDDSYYLLCSLEIVDENKKFIRKADMFSKRTIKPHIKISKTDNCVDALISSISEKASVDLEYMSNLTGKTEEQLIKELEGSIYKDPMLDKYVTADEYLSGNIREKLKIAQEFSKNNPEYEINVKALESVKIKDLSASEISVRLGATWIPTNYIEQFMFELLETPTYNRKDINVNYSNYTSDIDDDGNETNIRYKNGHAWVIDCAKFRKRPKMKYNNNGVGKLVGYQYERLVHCNFGWDGNRNGYYYSGRFDTTQNPSTKSSVDHGKDYFYQYLYFLLFSPLYSKMFCLFVK